MRHNVTTNELLSLIGYAMIVPMLVIASFLALFVVHETGLGCVLGFLSSMMIYVLIGQYGDIREKLELS